MSLTPEQRQAAKDFILTAITDERLAYVAWQTIGWQHEAAPHIVREVAAAHCQNVIQNAYQVIATHPDPAVRQQAQDNVTVYTRSAEALLEFAAHAELEVEVDAELVEAGS